MAEAPTKERRALTINAEAVVWRMSDDSFLIEVDFDGSALPPVKVYERRKPLKDLWRRIERGMVSSRNYRWGVRPVSYPAERPEPEDLEPEPPHESQEDREERERRNRDRMWDDGSTAFCQRPGDIACDLDPQFDFQSDIYRANDQLGRHKRLHRGLHEYETDEERIKRLKRQHGRGWRWYYERERGRNW